MNSQSTKRLRLFLLPRNAKAGMGIEWNSSDPFPSSAKFNASVELTNKAL